MTVVHPDSSRDLAAREEQMSRMFAGFYGRPRMRSRTRSSTRSALTPPESGSPYRPRGWPRLPSRLVVHKPEERTVVTMPIMFSRTAIIPVWVVAFALFAFFGSSMAFATAVLLLVVGVVLPPMMLNLWKRSSPRVAEVLHHV